MPVRAELLASINALARRHDEASLRLLDRRRNDLRALSRALPQAENLLATPRQRQDRAAERLISALRGFLGARRLALAESSRLLARHAPQAELQRATGRLNTWKYRLEAAGGRRRTAAAKELSPSPPASTPLFPGASGCWSRSFCAGANLRTTLGRGSTAPLPPLWRGAATG